MRQPCDEAILLSAPSDQPCIEGQHWVLAATILGSSMAFIDGTVVNVALPALQSSLHATVVDVQWVVESYGLFLSALVLIGGAIGDLIGRRRMFLIGVGVFAAASVACGLSSTTPQLVFARCVQGCGAAALVPSSLAIISAAFDARSRGQAIGTWSGSTAITTALGPVIGGWLVEHISWHWIFFINVPLATAVIVLALWHVPESKNTGARGADLYGALAATLGMAGVIYGLLESTMLGWHHPRVWGSLAVGLGVLVLFLIVEQRTDTPMVPLGMFKVATFRWANLLTFFLYAALGTLFFLFPMDLVQVQGYSATATGAAALPAILLMFFLSRWSGGLVARYGPRPPLVVGPVIAASGFFLFALPSVNAKYWTTFFPAFVVLGLGMAISVAPLTTVVMTSVEEARAGTASGINNAVARVAGVLAIAALGIVMVGAFQHALGEQLAPLGLAPATLHAVQSSALKLGGLEIPAGLDERTSEAVRTAVLHSFVYGFRIIMLLCGGLALTSAAVGSRIRAKKRT